MHQRAEELALEPWPGGNGALHELAIGVGIRAERLRRFLERAANEDRGAVVEGMSERRRRVDQRQVEVERPEEGRAGNERVDRGADVVTEPGERQLGGSRPAADRVVRFEDQDGAAGLRERDRGGETVRPRTDDDRV
jgi:hypothetical protein